jgi:nucleotide-binding universal stress UspA family protein
MRPILLATDGSPAALEATREAISLAEALHERLLIVGVEHITTPAYGYYGYATVYSELTNSEHVHVERVLADAAHAAEEAEVGVETIAMKGPVAETICAAAKKREARLIVIGSHGWNAVRRVMFGSVSTGVLHEATCPVLVVRAPEGANVRNDVRADVAAI